jgi:hypothetical protein
VRCSYIFSGSQIAIQGRKILSVLFGLAKKLNNVGTRILKKEKAGNGLYGVEVLKKILYLVFSFVRGAQSAGATHIAHK